MTQASCKQAKVQTKKAGGGGDRRKNGNLKEGQKVDKWSAICLSTNALSFCPLILKCFCASNVGCAFGETGFGNLSLVYCIGYRFIN